VSFKAWAQEAAYRRHLHISSLTVVQRWRSLKLLGAWNGWQEFAVVGAQRAGWGVRHRLCVGRVGWSCWGWEQGGGALYPSTHTCTHGTRIKTHTCTHTAHNTRNFCRVLCFTHTLVPHTRTRAAAPIQGAVRIARAGLLGQAHPGGRLAGLARGRGVARAHARQCLAHHRQDPQQGTARAWGCLCCRGADECLA